MTERLKYWLAATLMAALGFGIVCAQTTDAIVVESSTDVDCKDMRNTRITYHRVYRLIHDRASDLAQIDFACSKWVKLADFTGVVTDASGKVVRKFKKGDLQRTELSSNFADSYYTLYLNYSPPAFPVTIEYNWVVDISSGCFGFPPFTPMPAYNTQVEHATYSLTAPSQMDCRHLCVNTSSQVTTTTLPDGRLHYEARMDNLPAIESEPYDPPSYEVIPQILWAPSLFEFHGVQGNMSTWNGFGLWNQQLRQGRQQLDPEFRTRLHAMTDTCRSDRSKVQVIYRYFGETTRYVSIQLGIGGWQPFAANDVCNTGFGDCKGLSNYMCAMLNEVGVPANYVIIRNNHPHLHTNFPSNQFNHAIVQVPLPGDTLWLECTAAARIPLGHVHDGIAGADALLITDAGGQLCHLPEYRPEQNLMASVARIDLQPDGSATINIAQHTERRQYEDMMPLLQRSEQQRRDAMLKRLQINMPTLLSFALSESKPPYETPHIDVRMQIEARKFAKITGSRMFVPFNIFHQASVPLAAKARVQPVAVDYGYLDADTVIITVPEGFVIEALPREIDESASMGQVTRSITHHGDTITIVTRHLMRQGHYPASDYEALRTLKTQVQKAYRDNLVIKRKE